MPLSPISRSATGSWALGDRPHPRLNRLVPRLALCVLSRRGTSAFSDCARRAVRELHARCRDRGGAGRGGEDGLLSEDSMARALRGPRGAIRSGTPHGTRSQRGSKPRAKQSSRPRPTTPVCRALCGLCDHCHRCAGDCAASCTHSPAHFPMPGRSARAPQREAVARTQEHTRQGRSRRKVSTLRNTPLALGLSVKRAARLERLPVPLGRSPIMSCRSWRSTTWISERLNLNAST